MPVKIFWLSRRKKNMHISRLLLTQPQYYLFPRTQRHIMIPAKVFKHESSVPTISQPCNMFYIHKTQLLSYTPVVFTGSRAVLSFLLKLRRKLNELKLKLTSWFWNVIKLVITWNSQKTDVWITLTLTCSPWFHSFIKSFKLKLARYQYYCIFFIKRQRTHGMIDCLNRIVL